MAVKYYKVPEQKKTIAVLNGCAFDAINKIAKLTGESDYCVCSDKYMMPDTFRVETHCHGGDVFDEETGRKIAKAKLMKKYYRCFDRKMKIFKATHDRLSKKMATYFDENA